MQCFAASRVIPKDRLRVLDTKADSLVTVSWNMACLPYITYVR